MGTSMEYKGTIEKIQVKRDIRPNLMPLIVWYIGVFVSLFPLLLDMVVYCAKHGNLTRQFWINMCLRGDLICILATVLVMSVLESYVKKHKRKSSNLEDILTLVGFVLCAFLFALWATFKYAFDEAYNGWMPIVLTVALAIPTLAICSGLQVKLSEV